MKRHGERRYSGFTLEWVQYGETHAISILDQFRQMVFYQGDNLVSAQKCYEALATAFEVLNFHGERTGK